MTSGDQNFTRYKDISFTEPVTVTLPAHVWLAYFSAYLATSWQCESATRIAVAVSDQIVDPVWLKEQEASQDQAKDVHRLFTRFFTGQGPDLPPNVTDTP